jgi:hypothetical protein
MYFDPQSVRLAKEVDPPLDVTPFFGSQSTISLMLRGEKVQQLAIFDLTQGRWVVQELREPVKAASPVCSLSMTVYALGRRLYTYSTQAGRWSVLELPEGANPEGVANDRGLTLRYGDKVHIYNINSGEWTQFDLKAPAPPPGESKDEEE